MSMWVNVHFSRNVRSVGAVHRRCVSLNINNTLATLAVMPCGRTVVRTICIMVVQIFVVPHGLRKGTVTAHVCDLLHADMNVRL